MQIKSLFFTLLSLSTFASEKISEAELPAVEKRALSGDDSAFKRLFVALKHADGALAEEISISLGNTVEKVPEKFLAHLNTFNQGKLKCHPTLIANTGTYNDVEEQLILKKRIASLQKVKTESLLKIRNQCLKSLKEQY